MPLCFQKAGLSCLRNNTKGKTMTRKTIKAALAVGLLAVAARSLATEQSLPTPPPSANADAESSTTVPIPTDEGRHLKLTLAFEPTPVPLSFEYDDGWDSPPSDATVLMTGTPRRLLGASGEPTYPYRVERFPEVYVHPNYVTREQAIRELIHIRCNAAGIAARDYTSASGWAVLRFTSPSTAVIEEACTQDDINIYYRLGEKEVCGTIHIAPDWWWPGWDWPTTNDWSNVTNRTDGSGSSVP